jgi:uncharacterized membrane protein YjjB (DUF3815 family)
MDWPDILMNALWAGLFAGGLAVLLTAPSRYVVPTLVCGFLGRGSRNVLVASGMGYNWATVIAAAAIVLVAAAIVRNHRVSPVVLVCAVLPLGASIPMFNLIFGIMRVSALEGAALDEASLAVIANLGKVLTGSLAVALGLAAGVVIVRIFKRGEAVAV